MASAAGANHHGSNSSSNADASKPASKSTSSISSINSSINSVLSGGSGFSENPADSVTGCSNGSNGRASQYAPSDGGSNQHTPTSATQPPNQQQLNNSQNLAFSENPTTNGSFPNGQYLNSSASTYYTPFYKSQAGSHHRAQQSPASSGPLIDNLNNSLNQYLLGGQQPAFHHLKRELDSSGKPVSANEFDRTMDCKPIIQPANHPFGSSSSNRLNLSSSVISAYSNGKPPFCSGCKKAILDRFLLQTMGTLWHEDCLKCKVCECRLGEVGSSLFVRMEMLLCKRDYLR